MAAQISPYGVVSWQFGAQCRKATPQRNVCSPFQFRYRLREGGTSDYSVFQVSLPSLNIPSATLYHFTLMCILKFFSWAPKLHPRIKIMTNRAYHLE